MLENESKFDLIIACCFNAADVAVYETALGRKTPAPSDWSLLSGWQRTVL